MQCSVSDQSVLLSVNYTPLLLSPSFPLTQTHSYVYPYPLYYRCQYSHTSLPPRCFRIGTSGAMVANTIVRTVVWRVSHQRNPRTCRVECIKRRGKRKQLNSLHYKWSVDKWVVSVFCSVLPLQKKQQLNN